MGGGRLPCVSGQRVVQALTRAGFVVDRIVGSHHVLMLRRDPARTVTLPVHSNRDLKPGTLRPIVRQAGFTAEQFVDLRQWALGNPHASYLARQLYDIEYGARKGPAVALMPPEVAHMRAADRIAIVAYLASLRR